VLLSDGVEEKAQDDDLDQIELVVVIGPAKKTAVDPTVARLPNDSAQFADAAAVDSTGIVRDGLHTGKVWRKKMLKYLRILQHTKK
jgi:hypothetical protein